MNQMETGLRHRLRRSVRQMFTQHEHLRGLYYALGNALELGQVDEVKDAIDRLTTAIDAHFSLEDGVFFPALHRLHPERARELNALTDEHLGYLEDLHRLRKRLDTSSLDVFEEAYREFTASMAAHEKREESLIASMTDVSAAIR